MQIYEASVGVRATDIIVGQLPKLATIDCSHRSNPEFIDFTGSVFKDLYVCGLVGGPIGHKGARWLCRCACGNYTTRSAKSLKAMARGANSPQYCGDYCARKYTLKVEQLSGEKWA